jgi:hypothetical protein
MLLVDLCSAEWNITTSAFQYFTVAVQKIGNRVLPTGHHNATHVVHLGETDTYGCRQTIKKKF